MVEIKMWKSSIYFWLLKSQWEDRNTWGEYVNFEEQRDAEFPGTTLAGGKETKKEQWKVPEDIQEPREGRVSGERARQIPAQQGSRRFMSTGFGNRFSPKAGILISQGDSNSQPSSS